MENKRPVEKNTSLPCASVMVGGYRCLEHMIHAPDEVLIWSGSLHWFIVSFLFIKVDREHECFDLSVQNKSSVEQCCRLGLWWIAASGTQLWNRLEDCLYQTRQDRTSITVRPSNRDAITAQREKAVKWRNAGGGS